MKRRLILLRHGKSDWHAGAATDHARPLNPRGRRDAPRVAAELVARKWVPSHVWSSDAARTRETYMLMAPSFNPSPEAVFDNALYLGDLEAIRKRLSSVGDECTTAMLVGHNPGWEEAASILSGRDVSMTTCNAVLLSIKAARWSEALAMDDSWKLVEHIQPRRLK